MKVILVLYLLVVGVWCQCKTDIYEPNDNIDTASMVSTPFHTEVATMCNPSDKFDYYAFALFQSSNFGIMVRYQGGTLNLGISNAIGIFREVSTVSNTSHYYQFLPFAGSFAVAVENIVPTTATNYVIDMRTYPMCVPDRFEPNEVSGAAKLISVNTVYNLTMCTQLGDLDWFAFTLAASSPVSVILDFSTSTYYDDGPGALAMLMINATGTIIQRSTEYKRGYHSISVTLSAGTYGIFVQQTKWNWDVEYLLQVVTTGRSTDLRTSRPTSIPTSAPTSVPTTSPPTSAPMTSSPTVSLTMPPSLVAQSTSSKSGAGVLVPTSSLWILLCSFICVHYVKK